MAMTGMRDLARVPLVAGPTPLQPAQRLSQAVGFEVWLKRDDLTGFGLGGNKVRALEYLLGDAEARGCDCLVTGAGPQSNWAMLAALAARVRGLPAYVVYYGHPVRPAGNHRLAVLAGADVRFTGDAERSSVDDAVACLADDLRAAGCTPYIVPRGGAVAMGAAGYVRGAWEIADQLREAGLATPTLWLPTGSCGTQAGLLAGVRLLDLGGRVVGVTVSRPVEEARARVADLAAATADLLDADAPRTPDDVEVVAGYIGPGYGQPSQEGDRAAALLARTEGVLLDPVFGAKAMAALLDAGAAAGEPVVFLCTGGSPTLFTTPGAPP